MRFLCYIKTSLSVFVRIHPVDGSRQRRRRPKCLFTHAYLLKYPEKNIRARVFFTVLTEAYSEVLECYTHLSYACVTRVV